jgi:hypothetical protein
MDQWAYNHKVQMDFNRLGKPTDNATVESFNGKFREECLNAHWFESVEDAKEKIDAWRTSRSPIPYALAPYAAAQAVAVGCRCAELRIWCVSYVAPRRVINPNSFTYVNDSAITWAGKRPVGSICTFAANVGNQGAYLLR